MNSTVKCIVGSLLFFLSMNASIGQNMSITKNWDDGLLVISDCNSGLTPTYVLNAQAEVTEVIVFDVLGNYLASAFVKGNTCCLEGLSKGVYMLKGVDPGGRQIFVRRWTNIERPIEI